MVSLVYLTAADFTERVWKGLDKEKRLEVQRSGVYHMSSAYSPDPIPLSVELFRDGEKYRHFEYAR